MYSMVHWMEKEVYRICNNTAVALRAYESHSCWCARVWGCAKVFRWGKISGKASAAHSTDIFNTSRRSIEVFTLRCLFTETDDWMQSRTQTNSYTGSSTNTNSVCCFCCPFMNLSMSKDFIVISFSCSCWAKTWILFFSGTWTNEWTN